MQDVTGSLKNHGKFSVSGGGANMQKSAHLFRKGGGVREGAQEISKQGESEHGKSFFPGCGGEIFVGGEEAGVLSFFSCRQQGGGELEGIRRAKGMNSQQPLCAGQDRLRRGDNPPLVAEGFEAAECRIDGSAGKQTFPLAAADCGHAFDPGRPPSNHAGGFPELRLACGGLRFTSKKWNDCGSIPKIHHPAALSSQTASTRLADPAEAPRMGSSKISCGFHAFLAGRMCGLSTRILSTRATGVFLSTMIKVSPD